MWTLLALACRREDPPPTTAPDAHSAHTGAGAHTGDPVTGTTGHTGDSGGEVRVEPGGWCAPEDALGLAQITDTSYGAPALWVQVWDGTDPWVGAPVEETATCAFRSTPPADCGGCDPGEVCAPDGSCVPERRTVKDLTAEVTVGSDTWSFDTDPVLGQLYAALDPAAEGAPIGLTLAWGGAAVTLPPMAIASGDLRRLHVTVASSDFSHPGALDATWTPPPDGGVVRCRIPINHHAAGATFTECVTPASSGGFHATATMIDPLAVITGLEFQGVEHWQTAAVHLPEGCLDVRFGRQWYVPVEGPSTARAGAQPGRVGAQSAMPSIWARKSARVMPRPPRARTPARRCCLRRQRRGSPRVARLADRKSVV
jgi:hypothetical protein